LIAFATVLATVVCLSAQEPKEILRRALERDAKNIELLNTYMYEKTAVITTYEKDGAAKKREETVDEVYHIDGTEVEKTIRKNGKPLSEKEQAEEQKKFDKAVAKIRNESASERAKRRGETDKDKREEIEARREVLEAFDVKLHGVEDVNGRQCWKLEGVQRADFKGKGRRADQLKKMRGLVWIDQQSYEWAKMDLDSTDTISFGWFLFRLQKGARVTISQRLVNGEVWLPAKVDVRADARLLGKMLRVGIDVRYDNYRKFAVDSKLVTEADLESKR
jgi:hypothetical protein